MFSTEIENKVVVVGISAGAGLAARAELKAGDVILAVKGEKGDQPDRVLSKALGAGTRRRRRAADGLHRHEGVTFAVVLAASTDRTKLLKAPRLHWNAADRRYGSTQ